MVEVRIEDTSERQLLAGNGGMREPPRCYYLIWLVTEVYCCCCSGAKSCPTLGDPMDCSMPGLPVLHQLQELAHTHVHWVSDAVQPSHSLLPLLLLPSIFPSIGGFSNKSALCIKWPKYWSWSFSISPCSELSELISFRNDWFDLLAVQRTLKSLLQYT